MRFDPFIKRLPARTYSIASMILLLDFYFLSHPEVFRLIINDPLGSYLIGTCVLLVLNSYLIGLFHTKEAHLDFLDSFENKYAPWLIGLLSLIILFVGSSRFIEQVLYIPIDPYRADMLPKIQAGLNTLLSGHNLYKAYYDIAPWEIRFGYGPVLWAPYLIPHLLRIDLRFLNIFCLLFIPAVVLLAALILSFRKNLAHVLVLMALAYVICNDKGLLSFIKIGHTPVYWPLLFFLCYCFSTNRFRTTSFILALLLAARTTMIVIMPIFFMFLLKYQRRYFFQCVLITGITLFLLFIPFILLDHNMLIENMVLKYPRVVAEAIWTRPEWIYRTFGITGFLVKNHLEYYLTLIEIVSLLVIYCLTLWYMRTPKHALLWMAGALTVFSMTSIWPVIYLYFDVMFLFLCATIVQYDDILFLIPRPGRLLPVLACLLFLVLGIVFVAKTENYYLLDVGSSSARKNLVSGFSANEQFGDTSRTFCWAMGKRAEISLPRRFPSSAFIKMNVLPFQPLADSQQTVSFFLNKYFLGKEKLEPGWREIVIPAPYGTWLLGNNLFAMEFSYAYSPKSFNINSDERKLAVAFDSIEIEPSSR